MKISPADEKPINSVVIRYPFSNLRIFYRKAFSATAGDCVWPQADEPLQPILRLLWSVSLMHSEFWYMWIMRVRISLFTSHGRSLREIHGELVFKYICHLFCSRLQNKFTFEHLDPVQLPRFAFWGNVVALACTAPGALQLGTAIGDPVTH